MAGIGIRIFGANGAAVAVLLLFLACCSLAENPPTSSERDNFALVDANGRLRLGGRQWPRDHEDVDATAIVGTEVANGYRRRDKRLVFLLPLAMPAFGAAAAGTAAVGAAAATTAALGAAVMMSNANHNREPNGGRVGTLKPGEQYHTPPKTLEGFPDFETTKRKSDRKRWKDPKTGKIAEWDSEKGELEMYDKRGKHQGSFDPKTGKQRGGAKNRRIDP